MLAALAGVLGRGAAAAGAAEGGTFAMAKSAGGPPAIPGAASQSKQAANSLLSVSQNLDKTDKSAKEVAKGGIGQFRGSLQGVHDTVGKISPAFSKVLGLVTSSGAAVASTLTLGITALQAMADPIAQLTGLSNPAALEAFTRAINDDFAVIGRALLPITEAMTRTFQKLGEYLAGAEPILNKVATGLGSMIDRLGGEYLSVLKEAGPLLEVMGHMLLTVATVATEVVSAFISLAKWLGNVHNKVLALFGVTGSSFNKDASAKGAAVREISVQTSAEKISQDAQAKALQQALNPGKAPTKPPEEIQQSIYDLLQNFFDNKCPTKQDLIDFLEKLPGKLLEKLPGVGSSLGGVASDLNPLLGLIRSLMTR